MSSVHSIGWLAAILAPLQLLVGCGAVPAYQRGLMVQRAMLPDPNPPSTSMEQHVFEYREGSAGAQGTVGGGCGCN